MMGCRHWLRIRPINSTHVLVTRQKSTTSTSEPGASQSQQADASALWHAQAARAREAKKEAVLLQNLDEFAAAGNVSAAEAVLQQAEPLVSQERRRTMMFNTMLKACAQQKNVERADFWFSEMLQRAVQLNHKTFGKLIDAAAAARRVDRAEGFLQDLISVSAGHGLVDRALAGARVFPPVADTMGVGPSKYIAIISTCAMAGDPLRAQGWMHRMAGVADISPNALAYCAVISSLAKLSDVTSAQRWLQSMKDAAVQPTPDMFGSYVSAHARARDTQGALTWLQKTASSRVAINIVAYNAAISSCSRAAAKPAMSEALLSQAVTSRTPPDLVTYNALVAACTSGGDVARAPEWLRRCTDSSLQPGATMIRALVRGFEDVGDRFDVDVHGRI